MTRRQGCAAVRPARRSLSSWATSPDQHSLYAIADYRSVLTLRRNARTGTLTPVGGRAGCADGSGAFGCRRVRAMPYERYSRGPVDLAASPDGRSVYVLVEWDPGRAILVFARDRRTGALTQRRGAGACLSSRPAGGCRVVPGLASWGWALFVDPDGKTVIVAGAGQIAVYPRNPADGALATFAAAPTCFSFQAQADCETIASGEADGRVDAVFAPGGRSVSLTYSGFDTNVESHPSHLLTFDRDPATGALHALPDLAGCLAAQATWTLDGPPTCTGLGEAYSVVQPPAFLDDDTAVVASGGIINDGADVFMLKRDLGTRGLLPTGAPLTCWGRPAWGSVPCRPSARLGELLAGPVLAADRRTAYVASSRTLRSSGHLLSFAVNSAPPALAAPYSVKWQGRQKTGYWGPDPVTLQPSLDRRRLFFLSANGPALHSFGLRPDGQLSGGQHTCLGRSPGCGPARGLLAGRLEQPDEGQTFFAGQLVQSRDGRFLYALVAAGVAVFRLRR